MRCLSFTLCALRAHAICLTYLQKSLCCARVVSDTLYRYRFSYVSTFMRISSTKLRKNLTVEWDTETYTESSSFFYIFKKNRHDTSHTNTTHFISFLFLAVSFICCFVFKTHTCNFLHIFYIYIFSVKYFFVRMNFFFIRKKSQYSNLVTKLRLVDQFFFIWVRYCLWFNWCHISIWTWNNWQNFVYF